MQIKCGMQKKVLIGLFLFLSLNLFAQAYLKSFTTDEPIHLIAGLEYLKRSAFYINPEHPPLIKLLSATIPYFTQKVVFPKNKLKDYFDLHETILYIISFIRLNDKHIDFFVLKARFFPILLSIFLGYLIYIATKEIFGTQTGIIALLFYCLEPTFLGHGKLIHTDVGCALFYLWYFYLLYKCYIKPCYKNFFLLSLILGLGLITKFSLLILLPIHGLVMLSIIIKRQFRPILPFMFFIPWLVISASYFFHVSINSFFLPPNFLRGINLVIQHNQTGHLNYLLGNYSLKGWTWYFPMAIFLKETIPILCLFIFGIIYIFYNFKKYLFIIFPIVYYSFFAFSSHINIGLRHYLPVFPFLIIAASGFSNWLMQKNIYGKVIISILIMGAAIEAVIIFPHYISYFNPLAGGYERGWQKLSDSNSEWGQDIKALAKYGKKKHIENIEVYAFNCWLLPSYGQNFKLFKPVGAYYKKLWGEKDVNLIEENPFKKQPQYLAIGSSFFILPPSSLLPDLTPKIEREIKRELSYYRKQTPIAIIEKTIFIFKKY
ncbi:Dolichyl-phosphate-mannose-protein mannosyltransferase [Candidatus Methanoperedenaceae archaeon GB37]|nr:Dolichyl-phosphate-mannose-protein mannosyltransferase [Candidatus Methanoperedenaceae archaeon GB37]